MKIEKVGGPGKEFWVFGTNYPNAALPNRPDVANERGEWRVEVSPLMPQAENYFLNVMQVADNNRETLNDVKRLDGSRLIGVQVADRIVTFSKDSEVLSGKFDLNIEGDIQYEIVITDLKAGNWQVKKDGQIYIPQRYVGGEDGILTFEGSGGHYEFFR